VPCEVMTAAPGRVDVQDSGLPCTGQIAICPYIGDLEQHRCGRERADALMADVNVTGQWIVGSRNTAPVFQWRAGIPESVRRQASMRPYEPGYDGGEDRIGRREQIMALRATVTSASGFTTWGAWLDALVALLSDATVYRR
jgi:hypothetical protein